MDLANKIKEYYFDNINLLPVYKQFHFAHRLAAWQADKQALALLKELKPAIVPDSSDYGLRTLIQEILHRPVGNRMKYYQKRLPYFEKYPDLVSINRALFRVKYLKDVYGIDAKEPLFSIVNPAKIEVLAEKLLNDEEAMRTLATFAVNFIYLSKTMLPNTRPVAVEHITKLSYGYDLKQPEQTQLLVYLFTHAIIGETEFYMLHIASNNLKPYKQMLEILEPLIKEHFANLTIDNKLEYLVATRICSYNTSLFERIIRECEYSVSNEETFIADISRPGIPAKRRTFSGAEHQNVLFIMASSSYQPHSTIVV